MARSIPFCLVALLVISCDTADSPDVSVVSPFDGRYEGEIGLAAGSLPDVDPCNAAPTPMHVAVFHGEFQYTWQPDVMKIEVDAKIAKDGIVSGSKSYAILSDADFSRKYVTVSGSIQHDVMNLIVVGPQCTLQATLYKTHLG
jgi:hypothetical protein